MPLLSNGLESVFQTHLPGDFFFFTSSESPPTARIFLASLGLPRASASETSGYTPIESIFSLPAQQYFIRQYLEPLTLINGELVTLKDEVVSDTIFSRYFGDVGAG